MPSPICGWSCNITSVAHFMLSGGGIHPIKTHKVVRAVSASGPIPDIGDVERFVRH
jgi:hypothetical protein